MKIEQNVTKRRYINFRRRGIIQKKAHNKYKIVVLLNFMPTINISFNYTLINYYKMRIKIKNIFIDKLNYNHKYINKKLLLKSIIMKFMLLGSVVGTVTILWAGLQRKLCLILSTIWDFLIHNSYRSDLRRTKPNNAAGYFVKSSVAETCRWHVTSFECWDQECVELYPYL